MKKTIVIDGLSHCGKSTLSKMISSKLNIKYIDSGAIYRFITWYIINSPVDVDLNDLLNQISKIMKIEKCGSVIYNDQIMDEILRCDAVNQVVAQYAQNKVIREYVNAYLLDCAKRESIVMDGRDLGTIVFPNADIKIFLTASVDTRVKAWERGKLRDVGYIDLKERELFVKNVHERDYADLHREIAPLKCASDATTFDIGIYSRTEILDFIIKKYYGV